MVGPLEEEIIDMVGAGIYSITGNADDQQTTTVFEEELYYTVIE